MKIEEFINLKVTKKGYFFSEESLIELINDIKITYSKEWWSDTTNKKLQDCNNDKKRILQSLIAILEREYEAPVLIDFNSEYTSNKTEDEIDDDEFDDENNEK